VGAALWNSGVVELSYGWNYIDVDPPVSICGCCIEPGNPPQAPRILIAATVLGYHGSGYYPVWGFDNIGDNLENGCAMHSGFYGQAFEHCPPQWFRDPGDTTPDGTLYGYVELAWRIYLACHGPTAVQPVTWAASSPCTSKSSDRH